MSFDTFYLPVHSAVIVITKIAIARIPAAACHRISTSGGDRHVHQSQKLCFNPEYNLARIKVHSRSKSKSAVDFVTEFKSSLVQEKYSRKKCFLLLLECMLCTVRITQL